jgi:hypothetical protein
MNKPAKKILEEEIHPLRCAIQRIEAEPVEDGMNHPAEAELNAFLGRHGADGFLDATLKSKLSPTIVASLLRLLGRAEVDRFEDYEPVLRAALASPDLKIRDAAIQTIELWENSESVDLLGDHVESCPWLAEHITRVARELSSARFAASSG